MKKTILWIIVMMVTINTALALLPNRICYPLEGGTLCLNASTFIGLGNNYTEAIGFSGGLTKTLNLQRYGMSNLSASFITSWTDVEDRWEFLSNFTDDLGDRGYNDLGNFTNNPNYINYTFNLSVNYSQYVNMSNYEDYFSTLSVNYSQYTNISNLQSLNESTRIDEINTTATNANTNATTMMTYNSTLARIGTCTGTQVVQNTTTIGVQCTNVLTNATILSVNYSTYANYSQYVNLSNAQDLNESNKIDWLNTSKAGTGYYNCLPDQALQNITLLNGSVTGNCTTLPVGDITSVSGDLYINGGATAGDAILSFNQTVNNATIFNIANTLIQNNTKGYLNASNFTYGMGLQLATTGGRINYSIKTCYDGNTLKYNGATGDWDCFAYPQNSTGLLLTAGYIFELNTGYTNTLYYPLATNPTHYINATNDTVSIGFSGGDTKTLNLNNTAGNLTASFDIGNKANLTSPTFTGTSTFNNITVNGNVSMTGSVWRIGTYEAGGNFTGTCYNGTNIWIGTSFNASAVGC